MAYIFYEHNCLTEYNKAETYELLRAECVAKGEAEGTIKTLVSLLKKGLISENSAAEDAGMSIADFREAAAAYCV